MTDNGIALVAYYYAKKVVSEKENQKKDRNKEFQSIINTFLRIRRTQAETVQLIGDYLMQADGEKVQRESLHGYLQEFSNETFQLCEECVEEFLSNYEELEIHDEMIDTYLSDTTSDMIPQVSSFDVNEFMTEGVYHVDFGEQKLTMYVKGEDAVLFDLKLAEDRDQFKMSLLPKADMISALDTIIPGFSKMAKKAEKEGEYWELIADTLNSFIKTDILTVEQSEPYLMLSRKRHIDKDVAIDNIIELAPPFWKELIIGFEKSDRNNKSMIEAFSEKMEAVIRAGDIPENPYVSIQNGNKKLKGVEEYIEALEEADLEKATLLTKGGNDANRITVRSVLSTREITDPSPKLIKILDAKYKDKIKYRAAIRAEDGNEKSP